MRRTALLFAALLSLVLASPVFAQDLTVEAAVDRSSVTAGETVTLQVTVRGAGDIEPPRLPPLPQCTVHAAGQAQNVSIVNGEVSTSLTMTYLLTPRKVGTFTIAPVRVRAGGREAASQPLQIDVTAAANGMGGGTPSFPSSLPHPSSPPGFPSVPSQVGVPSFPRSFPRPTAEPEGRGPAFVTAEVDTHTPVVGQVITYRLKFHHAAGVSLLRSAQYPNTTGFLAEDLPPERTYTKVVDGRTYTVNEVRIAMIPTAEGHYEIGAAHLTCRVPVSLGEDDFGMLTTMTEKELETEPVAVDVKPLPAGRPQDFSGGVGRFTLSSRLDEAADAKVGRAMNLVLTVTGEGNVKMVQAPRLPAMPGLRVSDPVAGTSVGTSGDKVSGSRTFTVVVVPTKPGRLTLPAVTMSYYDAATATYKTVSTAPISLSVAPGTASAADASPAAVAPVPQAATDPRGLRPLHESTSLTPRAPIWRSPVFRALQLVPLALLVLAAGRWGPRLRTRERRARRGDALRRAQASLRGVSAIASLPPVLYSYLTEKLGASVSGMTSDALLDALRARGVSDTECAQLSRLLAAAEQARYAPMQPAPDATVGEADHLLTQLERSLS